MLERLCSDVSIKLAKAYGRRKKILSRTPVNRAAMGMIKAEIKSLGSILCAYNQRRRQLRAERRQEVGGIGLTEAIAIACEQILSRENYQKVMAAAERIHKKNQMDAGRSGNG